MPNKMVKIGYIFPGQGAQYVGMGKDFYESYPTAKSIFDRADSILGFSLSKICFEGPAEKVTQTSIAQSAIFTTSLAALEILKQLEPNLQPNVACGLSLGEFTALVAAGALGFEDGLRLVHKRGLLMEEAGKKYPGTMSSIIGLTSEQCETLSRESGAQIANFNSHEQIVFSGTKESIDKVSDLAQKKGAKKVIRLNVSGAFHSKLMEDAKRQLGAELVKVNIKTPKIPFIPNVTANFESDPAKIEECLSNQVTSSVQWIKTMELVYSQGIHLLLEVGPGRVLRGLARKINSELKVQNLNSIKDIDKLRQFLREAKESRYVVKG